MLNSSPHMKSDKLYTQSPQYKKQYPQYIDTNGSVRNSFTAKSIKENRQNTDPQIFNEELEYYKNRSADLEIYSRQLKNELDAMMIRTSKQGTLDDKTEYILHQNQMLNQDVDKLQKGYAQKKTECELWKSKYEQQLNSAVQLKAQYELDLKKLSNELKILEERNNLLEKERSQEVEATKTTFSIQSEQQKHSYLTQIDLLQNQVRKLREYADMRDKEMDGLELKFNQILQEKEYFESQLLKENDILRNRLQDQETEFSLDVNSLRQKQDIIYQGQIENLKKQYLTQQEIMDSEIEKLKGLLDIKNTEIETLLLQNKRMRANFEEETQTIRSQFEILEQKMVRNEQKNLEDQQNAERHLSNSHDRNMEKQKSDFNNQIKILEGQINHQKNQLLEQQNQLNELQKYSQQLLQNNQKDQEKAQSIINNLKKDILQQSEEYQGQIQKNYRDYEQQKQELINYNQQQSALMNQLSQQIQSLNQIIELKERQYETTLTQFKQLNNQSQNKLNQVTNENEQIKVQTQKYIEELEEQIALEKELNAEQEQKLISLQSTLQREKMNAERQIKNLSNQSREKDQTIEQLRIQIQAKELNLHKLQSELQDTTNTLSNLLEEEKHKTEQEVQSLQISQNEELANTKKKLSQKENTLKSELVQLKSELQTQQTLNSELNKKLELYGQQIESVVNNSSVIKQYQVLSEINLTNRLQN
ncbi:unnamed protein product (macronuclear) [Paramecium tetraurelia]|uniref:Uncharacterized protein n=1 Tax=Paramecium tetraurelia TaxID=5888 RepID=A0C7K4_PARTE|nr:uncharacterized protein GSPATT00035901001 [Paramecium tetraurelia]CAK66771.1 unnamed protein product [Paramecium tetraurelia]|eukprot:XP_001434168.1 hypothetical protein (macronuclear) [Paramecium tetraurelia strain d4-2]